MDQGIASSSSSETIKTTVDQGIATSCSSETINITSDHGMAGSRGDTVIKTIMEQGISGSSGNTTINVITNHDFSQGLHSWHANGCSFSVVSAESGHPAFLTKRGGYYAVVSNRTESWQGLEQDITSIVSPGSTYYVTAYVGVSGNIQGTTDVQATLRVEYRNSPTDYLFIGR